MCGIFTILNNTNTFTPGYVEEQFNKIKNRGKKSSNLSNFGTKVSMGHHSEYEENIQPIIDGDIILVCDGNVYNYSELYKFTNTIPKTQNNNEIIIHLYRRYGIEHTLQMLDGDFAFILFDNSNKGEYYKIYIARDPYGMRSLYMLRPDIINIASPKDQIIVFSSELKGVYDLWRRLAYPDETPAATETDASGKGKKKAKPKAKTKAELANEENAAQERKYNIHEIEAGTYTVMQMATKVFSSWDISINSHRYYTTGFNSLMYHLSPQYDDKEIVLNIQRYLIRSIEKRCNLANIMGKKMACLLSGGLDSSVITGLVRQYHVSHNLGQLETFSLSLEGGEDGEYAKKVAQHLGTNHSDIIIKEKDIYDAIPEVVRIIENYDVATVRAGLCTYLALKHIYNYSEATVIFTGDGADEVFGGYLYMYLADDSVEFDREVRRTIKNVSHFDAPRLDKLMNHFGFQAMAPFLDRSLVQYYLSIPPQTRFHTRNEQCEKFFLRLSFIYEYYRTSTDNLMIPEDVIWRTKEEFFDGVSSLDKASYAYIQDQTSLSFMREFMSIITKIERKNNIYGECALTVPLMGEMHDHLVPDNAEQYVYRKEFETHYKGCGRLIPEFWMPKYSDNICDPSARTLDFYNNGEDDSDARRSNKFDSDSDSEDDDA